MTATPTHLPVPRERPRRLTADASSRCDLVDILLGIRRDGFFRFEAESPDAALLLAEVRQLLSLEAQALRMQSSQSVHEIRLGRFPDESLS